MSEQQFCNAPNCPFKSVEQSVADIKKQQERFSDKQDAIILMLSEQKAMSVEIFNLKKSLDEFKDNIRVSLEENKAAHINIYEKINHLEQNKSDKSESKQITGWIWGGVIVVLSFLLNVIVNHVFKK